MAEVCLWVEWEKIIESWKNKNTTLGAVAIDAPEYL